MFTANAAICAHPYNYQLYSYGCVHCTLCGHRWGGFKETATHDSYGFSKPKGQTSYVLPLIQKPVAAK